jgi:predicted HicB family RNase H-like nuclease
MINHKHYTYRVIWSEEDQEYVGLCAEFQSLSFLAESQPEAFQGIVDLVGQIIADMSESGEPIPEPITHKQYSGKFMLRIPPRLHCELAIEAAEQRISLNRLISAKLAHVAERLASDEQDASGKRIRAYKNPVK